MIPLFFATSRLKYSKWLSVHVEEMKALPTTAPKVHEEFLKGNFVVRRTTRRFSSVSPDMALEQTLNKDVKNHGGIIGISNKDNARNKWFFTAHIKAAVDAELNAMIEKDEHKAGDWHHTDNKADQERSVEWRDRILSSFKSRKVNPFTWTGKEDRITNLVTGSTASPEQTNQILQANDVAKSKHIDFVRERLEERRISFSAKLKMMNVQFKPLAKPKKKATSTKQPLKCNATNEVALLSRCTLSSADGDQPIDVISREDLSVFPPSIAEADGTLKKGEKSKLKAAILKATGIQPLTIQPASHDTETGALVVDAMSVIHKLAPDPGTTFGNYALLFLRVLLKKMRENNCIRLDVAFDRYMVNSIKGTERLRRSAGNTMNSLEIVSDQMAVPKNWSDYLTVEQNKINLFTFIQSQWREKCPTILNQHESVITNIHGEGTMITRVGVTPFPNLQNNHDEADTMLVLHINNLRSTHNNIIVLSDDTDVLILLLHFLHLWVQPQLRIWMLTMKEYISINDIAAALGPNCTKLVGLHSITGCDTTSFISGITKIKGYKRLIDSKHQLLRDIGEKSANLNEKSYAPVIYDLYGYSKFKGTVTQLRYKMIAEEGKMAHQLPPAKVSLDNHIKRAHLQVSIELPSRIMNHSLSHDDNEYLLSMTVKTT